MLQMGLEHLSDKLVWLTADNKVVFVFYLCRGRILIALRCRIATQTMIHRFSSIPLILTFVSFVRLTDQH